jgi:glycine cleavage system regulatory protein
VVITVNTFGYVTYATRRVKSEGCNIIFSSVHTLMCFTTDVKAANTKIKPINYK